MAQDESALIPTLIVTAAIVERDGVFLITRRPEGVHLEGLWEFPGGKCADGESLAACLARELQEELGVDATIGDEILTTTHAYPDRRVELHFLKCELRGTPSPQVGQELRWVGRDELGRFEFPPADAELVRMLASR